MSRATQNGKLPDFLIVGAMKAGTTTLYRDLGSHPRIFFPETKELNSLRDEAVLTEPGRARYARNFASARSDQICGEASTSYTKLPDFPGIPARARELLGPRTRILYVMREPIGRLISHHHHDFGLGTASSDLDRLARSEHRYIAYSRYAMQIRPWLDAFGRDAIRLIKFEDYVEARVATVRSICGFLGVDPDALDIQEDRVFNASSNKPVPNRLWRVAVRDNPVYRHWIRPLLPWQVREKLREFVLPRAAAERPGNLKGDTMEYLRELFLADEFELRELFGDDAPCWQVPHEPPVVAASR